MKTNFTVGQAITASSTVRLRGRIFPPRRPSSAVMTALQRASLMRSRRLSALNPAKTTLWTAPMRAHANIAYTASRIMGM